MKASELRNMSIDELKKQLIENVEKKFKLRMQLSTKQLTNTNIISENRRDVARIKTLISEKMGTNHE